VRWQWVNPYTGIQHKNVLMGAGATNYPFFLDRMTLNDDTALLWTGSEWSEVPDDEYADREALHKSRSARAKKYSIAAKDGGHLTPPKDYPTNESAYGDPVNYTYPADEERARPALTYFNQAKNREAGGYSTAEWAVIGKRLAKLITKALPASYAYKDGRIQRREQSMQASEELQEQQDYQTDDIQEEETMSDRMKERLDEFAAMQEEAKASLEQTQADLTTATAEIQELKAQLAALEPAPVEEEGDVDESPEESADGETEDYAEKLAAMEEDFTARLDVERKAREKAEEAFTEERNTRRLAEFTETAKTWTFASEVEQFAEDLMAIEDHDPELYGRMVTRFNAINEQVASGELFAQHSVAGGEAEETDPFEREIERVRKERFSEKSYPEGFTAAMDIVASENPDLARRYAERH
jgi:hypothetical protein